MLFTFNRDKLLDLLLPQCCLLCAGKSSSIICPACAEQLPYLRGETCFQCGKSLQHEYIQYFYSSKLYPQQQICNYCHHEKFHFDQGVAIFAYDYPLDNLIQLYKFSGKIALGQWFAEQAIIHALTKFIKKPEAVIAMPLHPSRLQQRGYNQALIIAKMIAKHWQIPCPINYCFREKMTEVQSTLSRKQRRNNVALAFSCKNDNQYQHVCLVDDVLTSGATIDSCAKTLKSSGINEVSVLTLARAGEH